MGTGINITGGLHIGGTGARIGSPATAAMRALLSASGQTAYDAATSGNWFEVSSTDYAAVYSGLSGTSKVGMSDTQMNESGTSWSINYLTTLPQANATVASGNYIIGCSIIFYVFERLSLFLLIRFEFRFYTLLIIIYIKLTCFYLGSFF